MLVALGEKGVKTLDDFAGLVGDDLRGWFETKNGERVREPGVLESFQLTQEQADALMLNARIAAGLDRSAAGRARGRSKKQEARMNLSSVFPDR